MLPTKPSFFDTALENILRVDGKPFFRCVNPEQEKQFRAGKIRLKHIDFENFCKPKQCWVIEYYQSPTELNRTAWERIRYKWLSVQGNNVWTDMLGEYPENGRYVFFQDVVNELGQPIPPNQRLIDALTAKVREFEVKRKQWETETPEEGEQKIHQFTEEVEKEKVAKMTEDFFQYHGIAAKRAFDAVISKPLISTKPNHIFKP